MNQTNDNLWLSFEALAKTYPHDNGVRMTADLGGFWKNGSAKACVTADHRKGRAHGDARNECPSRYDRQSGKFEVGNPQGVDTYLSELMSRSEDK